MDRWKVGYVGQWPRSTYVRIEMSSHHWMDGWMDGQEDGWVGGWTNGWMGGRMDDGNVLSYRRGWATLIPIGSQTFVRVLINSIVLSLSLSVKTTKKSCKKRHVTLWNIHTIIAVHNMYISDNQTTTISSLETIRIYSNSHIKSNPALSLPLPLDAVSLGCHCQLTFRSTGWMSLTPLKSLVQSAERWSIVRIPPKERVNLFLVRLWPFEFSVTYVLLRISGKIWIIPRIP